MRVLFMDERGGSLAAPSLHFLLPSVSKVFLLHRPRLRASVVFFSDQCDQCKSG
jgi:hypothetical protein